MTDTNPLHKLPPPLATAPARQTRQTTRSAPPGSTPAPESTPEPQGETLQHSTDSEAVFMLKMRMRCAVRRAVVSLSEHGIDKVVNAAVAAITPDDLPALQEAANGKRP